MNTEERRLTDRIHPRSTAFIGRYNLREQAPLYLTGAAAAITPISISGFEIFVGLALLAMLATRARWRVPPIWLPLALFILGTLVSLIACGDVRGGLPQIRKLYVYLVLFLVASTFRTIRQVTSLAVVLSIAAAISAARGTQQFIAKYHAARQADEQFYFFYVDRRITGFLSHWMTLGGVLMIALLVIAALVLLGKARARWYLTAAAVPVAVALEETWTRSAWLGAFCGAVILVWMWKRWALLLVPVLVGVLWFASPPSFRERAESSYAPHGAVDSNLHRKELRAIGWQMVKAHPWLGIGPQQVVRQIPQYLPPGTPLRKGQYYGHLENDYLQYAAERGIPTMLALVWMLGWALTDFAKALRRLPRDAGERWIYCAGIAVTAAMLVSGYYSWNLNNSNILAMYLTILGCGYGLIPKNSS